jgi:hypothetical protein
MIITPVSPHGQAFVQNGSQRQQVTILLYRWSYADNIVTEEFLVAKWGGEATTHARWVPMDQVFIR